MSGITLHMKNKETTQNKIIGWETNEISFNSYVYQVQAFLETAMRVLYNDCSSYIENYIFRCPEMWITFLIELLKVFFIDIS